VALFEVCDAYSPFDLESGVRVTCDDVGYLYANFSLLRPLFSTYARCTRQTPDRQTSDAHHPLMPPPCGVGHNQDYLLTYYSSQAEPLSSCHSVNNSY